jgi:hypothetical protein
MTIARIPPILLVAIALGQNAYALTPPAGDDHAIRDPVRRFELQLTADWQVLPEAEARALDPEAAVVARHREEKIYLSVEARRLPGVALTAWANAWGQVQSNEETSPFFPRPRSILARTEHKFDGEWLHVVSTFRRAHGWAYRFSRYHPFRAGRTARRLVRSAARWFRPLPGVTAPPSETSERGREPNVLRRVSGLAASLVAPSGWEAVAAPDRDATVFVPGAAALVVRDRLNGYQGGLFALGEVTRSDDLTVRLARWLDEHLVDAIEFQAAELTDSVRVTCISTMPEGRRPAGLPITWITEGRIVDGQGIAILAGVTGLGLEEDYDRMTRVFEGLRTVDARSGPAPGVHFRDGAIFSPDPGFLLRLPEAWVPHLEFTDPMTASQSLLFMARRGPAPAIEGVRPPVTARVERVPKRGGLAFAALRARLAPPEVAVRVRAVQPLDPARPAWEIRRFGPDRADRVTITLLPRLDDGGSIALITRTPRAAWNRLRNEIRELHAAFHALGKGRIELTANRGAHLAKGTYRDPVRGVQFEVRGEWTWSDGDHARAVDPTAVVACWRRGPRSGVRFMVAAERVPGYSVREWAAYQRAKKVREGPGGRLYTESRDSRGHAKSILEVRQGWCYRATLVLPDYAEPAERREGFVALRSFRTRDARPVFEPARRGETPSRATRRHGPVVVTRPARWRFVPIEHVKNDFPLDPFAVMVHEDFGYRAVFVALSGAPDLGEQGARLESMFFREMPGGRVLRPSRSARDGVWFEAVSEVSGDLPGSRLPGCWLVRVACFRGQAFAAMAWCKGKSIALERSWLEQALRCMTAAPAGNR